MTSAINNQDAPATAGMTVATTAAATTAVTTAATTTAATTAATMVATTLIAKMMPATTVTAPLGMTVAPTGMVPVTAGMKMVTMTMMMTKTTTAATTETYPRGAQREVEDALESATTMTGKMAASRGVLVKPTIGNVLLDVTCVIPTNEEKVECRNTGCIRQTVVSQRTASLFSKRQMLQLKLHAKTELVLNKQYPSTCIILTKYHLSLLDEEEYEVKDATFSDVTMGSFIVYKKIKYKVVVGKVSQMSQSTQHKKHVAD